MSRYTQIEPLINESAISNIKVLGPNEIRCKTTTGTCAQFSHPFEDEVSYDGFINGLLEEADLRGLNLKKHPVVSFCDTTSYRGLILKVVISNTFNELGPKYFVHIRKIMKVSDTCERISSSP